VRDLAASSSSLEGPPAAPVWLLVLWVVVLGTAVPYVFTLASMTHLTAAAASVASLLEPILAGVLAWVLLGETLEPVQIVGAGLVLAGLAVAELSGAPTMRADAALPNPSPTGPNG
jgi:drug/metabolite transporter (DMT)-like permease